MNRRLLLGIVMIGIMPLLADPSPTPSPENPASAVPGEARLLAVEAARVFTKEGYRLRDGEWTISLGKGESRLLKVTLFAGEQYGFVAASPVRGAKLTLTLFDPSGHELKAESRNAGSSRPGLGIAAKASGLYLVKVECLDGAGSPTVDTSLIYTYK